MLQGPDEPRAELLQAPQSVVVGRRWGAGVRQLLDQSFCLGQFLRTEGHAAAGAALPAGRGQDAGVHKSDLALEPLAEPFNGLFSLLEFAIHRELGGGRPEGGELSRGGAPGLIRLLAQCLQENRSGLPQRPIADGRKHLELDLGAGIAEQPARGVGPAAVAVRSQGLCHLQPHAPRRVFLGAEHQLLGAEPGQCRDGCLAHQLAPVGEAPLQNGPGFGSPNFSERGDGRHPHLKGLVLDRGSQEPLGARRTPPRNRLKCRDTDPGIRIANQVGQGRSRCLAPSLTPGCQRPIRTPASGLLKASSRRAFATLSCGPEEDGPGANIASADVETSCPGKSGCEHPPIPKPISRGTIVAATRGHRVETMNTSGNSVCQT